LQYLTEKETMNSHMDELLWNFIFNIGFRPAETGWILKIQDGFRLRIPYGILKFQSGFCLRIPYGKRLDHQVSDWLP